MRLGNDRRRGRGWAVTFHPVSGAAGTDGLLIIVPGT